MNEQRSKGCLISALIWIVILAILAAAYRYLVHPRLADRLQEETGSSHRYKDEVLLAADAFSGYAVLRSEALRQELKVQQIKLQVQDDKADYAGRLRALREGKVQLAVFTLDSLLVAGAKAGDFPATIVLILDETKGGDAIVARRGAVNSLQDLNHPTARIVLTPGSPSEFLARVVLTNFNLPDLPGDWLVPASGVEEVLSLFRAAQPDERKAFVLWEPYVTMALESEGAHVLMDSAKLKGYIVDVLVAQRQFLRDRPEVVKSIVEAYLRAAHAVARDQDALVRLVLADARRNGSPALTELQASKLAQGIQWKNTVENYAHFGLAGPQEAEKVRSLEDMIAGVSEVLVKTGALARDPLEGRPYMIFYDRILAELKNQGFHPDQLSGAVPETESSDRPLPSLSSEQWEGLLPVGEFQAPPLEFVRASAALSLDGERALQDLARRLQTFPRYYLRVVGHARAEGDPQANAALARERAETTLRYLAGRGLSPARLRAESAPGRPSGAAQAVSFFIGQLAY